MSINEIATKNDLENVKAEILSKIEELLNSKTNSKTEFLRTREVLNLLKISASSLQSFRKNGIIPFTKINGTIYYKQSTINELLNSGFISDM